MRTFVVVALVACMAAIFVEFSQVNAQRGGSRMCRRKPSLNSTDEVTCDDPQRPIGRAIACRIICSVCYEREQLADDPGCLVRRRCVCLEKGDGEGNSTTEPSTDEPETTPTDWGSEGTEATTNFETEATSNFETEATSNFETEATSVFQTESTSFSEGTTAAAG